MYVVYIEEAFKFIPKEQFVFHTLDEYSEDTVSFSDNLFNIIIF